MFSSTLILLYVPFRKRYLAVWPLFEQAMLNKQKSQTVWLHAVQLSVVLKHIESSLLLPVRGSERKTLRSQAHEHRVSLLLH